MAVPAKKPSKRARLRQKQAELQQRHRAEAFVEQITRKNGNLEPVEEVKLTAARLYGQGFKRGQIARALGRYLCPNSKARTSEQVFSQGRQKLRKWEQQKEFRDLIWQHAVVELDMSTPEILAGVSRSARRGRVDAARLALEVTGRHTKEADVATNVTIQIANIPRPQ
jgi:hypothetical protein